MKYILITYHMDKIDFDLGVSAESAETCIRLPMMPELADRVLKFGPYKLPFEVKLTLVHIAELQGYRFTGAVDVKEVGLNG